MALKIDGSEGGGQILRNSLALSCFLQKPFSIVNIRKNRKNPGIKSQHLNSIKANQILCDAQVQGNYIGSGELLFIPKKIKKKNFEIDIKTAGSITLLLQSLILPISFGKKAMTIKIKGGTDVPFSIPIDFYSQIILNNFFFIKSKINIIRRGFYPKGGGEIEATIKPLYEKKEEVPKINQSDIKKLAQIKGVIYATKTKQKLMYELQELLSISLQQKFKVPVFIEMQNTTALDEQIGLTLWGITEGKYRSINIGYDSLIKYGKEEIMTKILNEINFDYLDSHYIDNLIPFIGLIGGKIKIKKITNHMKSSIYVTEKFIEKKFKFQNNILSIN